METMKKINFFSDLKLNIKWGMILMFATFVFIAKTGFSKPTSTPTTEYNIVSLL
jgi:hypothetical protein